MFWGSSARVSCDHSLFAIAHGDACEGRLHLHPINETHQFRPTLTYMDMHLRKSRRTRPGDESDDDEGPPPDPDEPAPAPVPKKEKKPAGEAKEVQVAVRKTGESQGLQFTGGMTQVRRDMLTLIHAEEDERWDDYEYCGGEVSGADWSTRRRLMKYLTDGRGKRGFRVRVLNLL